MSIYQRFCEETVDENGALERFSLRYPENFNFGYDVVDAIAQEEPDREALIWCDEKEERRFTFDQMRRLSNQAANVLLRSGIGRGDRVLVALKRHYEYWFTVVALHKIGAVLVPVTHMLTVSDFQLRIRNAEAKAVICTPQDQVPQRVRAAAAGAGGIHLFTVRETAEGFENLTLAMEHASDQLSRIRTLAGDPMLMYYTSGTTGDPKGVVHAFTYPLAHIITARYWQQAEDGGLHFTVAETGWGKASWGKIYGQWLVGAAVMVFDFDRFEPLRLVEIINRFHVTSFCAPATVYRYLVRFDLPAMPSLKHASTAGEALSEEVYQRFRELTGLALCGGYGQTETVLLLANMKGKASRDGCLGTPSPLFHLKLVDRDGREVPDGEIGEIVVCPETKGRQDGLFLVYLKAEEESRRAWRGGVYHTGDLAYRDRDGTFWFHSRVDEVIKTSGYRVGPYEIEKVLQKDPAVAECCVVGIPDRLRGQAIKAYVVLKEGEEQSPLLANRIRGDCNCHLAEYKWVRTVEFVEKLPRTISGKVRSRALRPDGDFSA